MASNDDNGGGGDGGQAATGGAADLLGGAAAAGGGDGGGEQGGGDGGGGDGGAATAGGDPAGGVADPDWYQQLSAEGGEGDEPSLRDWAKARGYKTLDDVVKSARDNQKALRDSGRVKVPGEGASAEEIAAFNKAIGVPDDPKGYKLPEIKDAEGNPIALNSDKLGAIAGIAHKHGIPAKALEATLQEIAEADAMEFSQGEAEIQRRADAHVKGWGSDKSEKIANIDSAARALGLTRDEILSLRSAWGPERALDIFAKLGAGISEDTMVTGGGNQRFGISGDEAQRQLNEKRSNAEWASKAMVPGTPENAEYKRLNDAIGAAADRKAQQAA